MLTAALNALMRAMNKKYRAGFNAGFSALLFIIVKSGKSWAFAAGRGHGL